jgi:hypothetical protein
VEPSASHWHCSDRFVIQDPYNWCTYIKVDQITQIW